MVDIPGEIARLGGAAKACELLEAGASRGMIRGALRVGIIRRPRKGWYVLPGTPPTSAGAVRVGGRATCVTALRLMDVWILRDDPLLHVAVHRSACQLRSAVNPRVRQSRQPDAVVHWVDTPRPRAMLGSRLVETPLRALEDAAACLPAEELFIAAESVRGRRLVTGTDWGRFVSRLPRRIRRVVSTAGQASGSGIESIAVYRLRRLKMRVRQQVQIGMDRVDIVIGDRLVIELDGARHHPRHPDYVRDARLIAAGYTVLRFDYQQVVSDWGAVEAAILAAVARRLHVR